MKKLTEGIKEAMDRFNHKEGNNFTGYFTDGMLGDRYVETRVRKSDQEACIIMYYENGMYQVFEALTHKR